jgi:hypothetical protein
MRRQDDDDIPLHHRYRAGTEIIDSAVEEIADLAFDVEARRMTRALLAAAAALPLLAGQAVADPFNDPGFPIYRWHPLVQHDGLNDRTIIFQPTDPAAPYTRDYSAPRIIEQHGTLYQTLPGGGARDWSVPPIDLAPMDFGFGEERP